MRGLEHRQVGLQKRWQGGEGLPVLKRGGLIKTALTRHRRYETFLEERTPDESKRGWHYTHKRLLSAYRSLKSNLPYLFTYKRFPKLTIPKTTNSLDGGLFSPLKDLLKVHRGIGDEMKKKLIVAYLENLRIQQPKNPL